MNKNSAPQGETLPANVKNLEEAGFDGCIIRNEPCPRALRIHQVLSKEAVALCCKEFQQSVTVQEAAKCKKWQQVLDEKEGIRI